VTIRLQHHHILDKVEGALSYDTDADVWLVLLNPDLPFSRQVTVARALCAEVPSGSAYPLDVTGLAS
jgi:hypothetical protein